jgi:hypothetical protein
MASYHQPPAYQQPQAMKGGGKSGAGPVAGVDGNWACQTCQNVNFAVRSVAIVVKHRRLQALRLLEKEEPQLLVSMAIGSALIAGMSILQCGQCAIAAKRLILGLRCISHISHISPRLKHISRHTKVARKVATRAAVQSLA